MITFEITQSPDQNVMRTFTFHKNQVYLGRSRGDLWINDPELLASNSLLEVIENELLIHPQKEVEFYLINGKRASVIRKIKRMDLVTIGKTTFRIIDFSVTTHFSKKEVLDSKLDTLITENSPRLQVIEELSKLMK